MPGKRPSVGSSVLSGNRMSALHAEEMKAMMAKKPAGSMPSPGQSAQSANRIAAQEAAEMKMMKMKMKNGGKVRKYADGGIVVSRGADDISRFRLGMVDDTPMTTGIGSPRAAMAADAMAMNEDMSSGPAMETPKARKAPVRRANSSPASPPPIRKASNPPAPRNTARANKPETQPALTAADRRTMRDVLTTPMAKPATKTPAAPRVGIQNLAEKVPAAGRYIETVKKERNSAAAGNQATVERYLREGRIPTARAFAAVSGADFEAAKRNVARAPKAPATRGMSDAAIRSLTAGLNADADRSVAARRMAARNDVAAVDAALRRQMQGQGPLAVRPRAPMALKNGGSVKMDCRGKSNMAMMAKALKGK